MRLLLDTHTFLWFVDDHPALSNYAREVIEANDNEVLLSIDSLWEIGIKLSIGKLVWSKPFDAPFVRQLLSANELTLLNISLEHIAEVTKLPFHHKDPLDRMLIAQT